MIGQRRRPVKAIYDPCRFKVYLKIIVCLRFIFLEIEGMNLYKWRINWWQYWRILLYSYVYTNKTKLGVGVSLQHAVVRITNTASRDQPAVCSPKTQMERDDRATEVDILKEKLEKAQAQVTWAQDEKETANREFERALEKCDKYGAPLFPSSVCM